MLRKRLTHAEIEAYLALMTQVTMSSASGSCSHAEIEAYLAVMTHALVNPFSPVHIVLFGSLTRGDHNRISDANLVVIAATELSFCERIGLALESCHDASTQLPAEALAYAPANLQRRSRFRPRETNGLDRTGILVVVSLIRSNGRSSCTGEAVGSGIGSNVCIHHRSADKDRFGR